MRKLTVFLSLSCLVFCLSGCPLWRIVGDEFRSADLSQLGGRGPIFFDDLAGDAPGPPEDNTRTVTEPDIIRQAGHYLYILNQYRGLMIFDLDTDTKLAELPTYGLPRDLYLDGDRAYVLVSYATNVVAENTAVSFESSSRLYTVDVHDPAAAAILSSFDIEGELVDSRLVGDVLYAVGGEFQYYYLDVGLVKGLQERTWVTAINVADPAGIYVADQLHFAGSSTVLHVTPEAIFAAVPDYQSGNTTIQYVDISDPQGAMAVRGTASITGWVHDRFKMDAYQGVLRVVSSAWNNERRVFISTIDLADPDHPAPLAETEFASARGESLFATRFDGDRAYVVTYFMVDPLHVVDLSDPSNPQVVGELEVPGWSTHIEPMGDRLLALGVDDTDGQRVSVSLFDVSDPAAPGLLDRVSLGEQYSWSVALNDVKAFNVLDDLILVPLSGWTSEGAEHRLQFVSWTANDLTARGAAEVGDEVLRSVQYADRFYAVSALALARIDASDLDHPVVSNTVTLAEYVADFIEATPSAGYEIITDYSDYTTTLRAVGLPLKQEAGIPLNIGSYLSAHLVGERLAVVGIDWNAGSQYKVAIVDVSQPATPELLATIEVPMTPYYGYYFYPWYDYAAGVADKMVADDIWWPRYPYAAQSSALVANGKLILRGTAAAYDATIGEATPEQGLAVIDPAAAALVRTIGLGIAGVQRVDESGGALYLTTKESTALDSPRPRCAYYVRTLDLEALSAGPAANVPGEFVLYDAAAKVLTLRDYQWGELWDVQQTLRTVSWDGGDAAFALDEFPLDPATGSVVATQGRVYVDAFTDAYRIAAVDIESNGDFTPGDPVTVSLSWGTILGARGEDVLVQAGSGAVAYYAFDASPHLVTVTPTMSYPSTLRFGEATAYLPLGYAGVASIALE